MSSKVFSPLPSFLNGGSHNSLHGAPLAPFLPKLLTDPGQIRWSNPLLHLSKAPSFQYHSWLSTDPDQDRWSYSSLLNASLAPDRSENSTPNPWLIPRREFSPPPIRDSSYFTSYPLVNHYSTSAVSAGYHRSSGVGEKVMFAIFGLILFLYILALIAA